MSDIKTFDDLQFGPHTMPRFFDGQAVLFFDNGYGVSVVTGLGVLSGGYELAVVTEDGLHYDNPVADGAVVGGLSEDAVTALMAQVQGFDKYRPRDI